MAQLANPFSCDVCGVHKGEQNHWFKVFIHPGAGRVSIAVWDRPINPPMFHCCGEEHALRKAAELLGKIKQQSGGTDD